MVAKDAEALLKEYKLDECLSALQDVVRQKPADPQLRVFLFQLLCVRGDWDRALTQLKVFGGMDAKNLLIAELYQQAIACEALRREVFEGKRTPMVFGEPPEWMASHLKALELFAKGEYEAASSLRSQVAEQAPSTPGTADGESFEWIADYDARLGPVMEMIVRGTYYWTPFQSISKIEVTPPNDLRDLVWAQAQIELDNGGSVFALIPTRYPGSESNPSGRVRLAKQTEWKEVGESAWIGQGQRLFVTDSGHHSLLGVKNFDFRGGSAAAADGTGGGGDE